MFEFNVTKNVASLRPLLFRCDKTSRINAHYRMKLANADTRCFLRARISDSLYASV